MSRTLFPNSDCKSSNGPLEAGGVHSYSVDFIAFNRLCLAASSTEASAGK